MSTNLNFSNLVLLVGTNPLPNYVVAKYFCSNNKNLRRIWLLYSEKTAFEEGTKQYAEDIEAVLKKIKPDIHIEKSPLSDVSKDCDITKDVKDQLLQGIDRNSKVHLNYTGGTKSMAVHVYRFLEENLNNRFSASYLDARNYCIVFDNRIEKDTDDLRGNIKISWDDLFQLYNCERTSGRTKYLDRLGQVEKENLLQRMINMAEKRKLLEIKKFYQECNNNIRLFSKPKENEIIDMSCLKKLIDNKLASFNPKNNPELFKFLAAFPEEDRIVDENGNWLYDNFPYSGKNRSKNTDKLNGFLSGEWLEAYVYWVIKTKKPELDPIINLYASALKINTTKTFEMDILVKNGYQICGISCGTAAGKGCESQLKQKGFEVILRSRQLGGDEALAILVTILQEEDSGDTEKIRNLEQDLKDSTRTNPQKFIVLCAEDLHPDDLYKKIKKHIYGRN
mgnify:CR=1 FL=1